MIKDIFISYARKDLARVEPIVMALEQHGWRPIIDKRAFLPGVTWPDEIQRALDSSRCVLVVWTSESVDLKNHEWVKREAEAGKEKGILVALRLDVVDPPPPFEFIQYAELSGWNGDRSHPEFLKCIEAIKSKIPVQKIIDMLDDQTAIPDALMEAENIQFRGSDRTVFTMKRRRYFVGMNDYELLNWIGEMKCLIAQYLG